jgi:hypothetical protein
MVSTGTPSMLATVIGVRGQTCAARRNFPHPDHLAIANVEHEPQGLAFRKIENVGRERIGKHVGSVDVDVSFVVSDDTPAALFAHPKAKFSVRPMGLGQWFKRVERAKRPAKPRAPAPLAGPAFPSNGTLRPLRRDEVTAVSRASGPCPSQDFEYDLGLRLPEQTFKAVVQQYTFRPECVQARARLGSVVYG